MRGHSRRKNRVIKGLGVLCKRLPDKKWIKKSENSKSSLLLHSNGRYYPVGKCELLKTLEQHDYHANKFM